MTAIRILVIDDDPNIRTSLLGYFQNQPEFVVEAFEQSTNGLEKLAHDPEYYNIVLLDWVLNEKETGGEALANIHQMNPYLPVIVLTARAYDFGPESIRKGAAWQLYKPFDMAVLTALIRTLTDQDTALRLLAENAQELLGSTQCFIWWVDRRTQSLRLKAYANADILQPADRATTLSLNAEDLHDALSHMLKQERPVIKKPLSAIEDYHHPQFISRREGWKARVTAALRYKGELLGLLEAYYSQAALPAAERWPQVSTMLAELIRSAADARYNNDQNRRTRTLINKLSSLLDQPHNLKNIIPAILTVARALIDAPYAWLYVHETLADGGRLTLVGQDGPPAPQQLPLNSLNLASQAAQRGVLELIPDTQFFLKDIAPLVDESVRTQMAIPLRRAGMTTAVLVVGSNSPDAFTVADKGLMDSFTSMATPALDQARLRAYLDRVSTTALRGKTPAVFAAAQFANATEASSEMPPATRDVSVTNAKASAEDLAEVVVDALANLTGKPIALWVMDPTHTNRRLGGVSGLSDAAIRVLERRQVAGAPGGDLALDEPAELGPDQFNQTFIVPLVSSEGKEVAEINLFRHSTDANDHLDPYQQNLVRSFAGQAAPHLENLHRRQTLENLLESVQAALPLGPDENLLLHAFAEAALKLTGASFTVIYPYDARRSRFYDVDHIVVAGDLNAPINKARRPRHRGLADVIRSLGKLVVYEQDEDLPIDLIQGEDIENLRHSWVPIIEGLDENDLEAQEWDRPLTRQDVANMVAEAKIIQRENILAFAGFALRAPKAGDRDATGVEEVGVLYVNFRIPHRFTPSELQMLELFARQAAAQVSAARLGRRQQILLQASSDLAGAATCDQALAAVFQHAFKLAGEVSGLVLRIQANHTLRIVDHYRLEQAAIDAFHNRPVTDQDGSFGEVVRTGQKFTSQDTRADLEAGRLKRLELPIPGVDDREAAGQLSNYPLKAGGRTVGILVLDTVVDQPEVEQAIQALLDIGCTVLEKILAEEDRAAQLEAITDIVDAIDQPDVFEIILSKAARLSGSDYGVLALCNPAAAEEELQSVALWEGNELKPLAGVPQHQRSWSWLLGLTGDVARTGRPRREGDLQTRRPPGYIQWYSDCLSELTLPLTTSPDGPVLGVLDLESKSKDAYTDEMQTFFSRLANIAAQVAQKTRILKDTRRLNEQMNKLYKLVGEVDLNRVLKQTLESLNDLMGVEDTTSSINLYRKNAEGDDVYDGQLHSVMAIGPNEKFFKVPARKPGEGGTAWHVVQTGEALYLPDVRNVPPGKPNVRSKGREEVLRSFAALPMKRRDNILGVLFVHKAKPDSFDPETQRMLETFAGQAAIAIDNAQRLFDAAAFRDINEAITAQSSRRAVLRLIVQKAAQSLCADAGSLLLLDEQERHAELFFAPDQATQAARPQPILDEGQFINARVVETLQLTAGDYGDDIAPAHKLFPEARAYIAAPILYHERMMGILRLESAEAGRYSQKDEITLSGFAEMAAIAIRTHRAFEQRLNDLKALEELIAAMVNQDIAALYQVIAAKARNLTGEGSAAVWLLDTPANCVRLGAVDGTEIVEQTLPLDGDSAVAFMIQIGHTYVYNNTQKGDHHHTWSKDIRSGLCAPMIFAGNLIGGLTVESTQEGAISAHLQELLEAIANVAASAIYTARVVKLKDARGHKLSAVAHIAARLTAQLRTDEHEILSIIHEHAGEVLDTDNMFIALYDPKQDQVWFDLAFVDGKPVDIANDPDWAPRSKGTGATEWVLRTKQPMLLADKSAGEAFYNPDGGKTNYINTTFASWVGAPMIYGDHSLGVIATYHKTIEHKYDQEDMAILAQMANWAAIAIHNARAYQELETARDRLERRVHELQELRLLAEALNEELAHVTQGRP